MTVADPNYRYYVELKGTIQSEERVIAPFTEREVAYYRNRCYSVNEETETVRDANGNTRTRVAKAEHEIANEKSQVAVFLKDQSCDTPVYIDIESFGGDVDLQTGCDRFEPQNSIWMQSHMNMFHRWAPFGGSRFLGYRLKEEVLYNNQPIYALGELYRNGDRVYIGKSVISKKPSKLSYKSEDQLISDTKKAKMLSMVIGGGAAVIGLVLVVLHFV